MNFFAALLAGLGLIASLSATQTPPNTVPAVHARLEVTYNETCVTPGLLFPPSSELDFIFSATMVASPISWNTAYLYCTKAGGRINPLNFSD